MTSVDVLHGNNSGTKAPKDAEQVAALITELRKEFAQRLDVLQAEYVASKNKQQQVLASGMVKLNKNIKSMTVREFNALYKCNLLQLVQAVRENNSATTISATAITTTTTTTSPSKKRDRGMTAETPSHQGIKMKQPQSASRTVRRGEALFSMNGSPVETADQGSLIATITKKKRPGGLAIADDNDNDDDSSSPSAQFDINVGDGKIISLNDPSGINDLNDEMKNAALHQLKILQDQMAKVMQQLEN